MVAIILKRIPIVLLFMFTLFLPEVSYCLEPPTPQTMPWVNLLLLNDQVTSAPPPTLNPIGNKYIDEESNLSFTISADSPEGLDLEFFVYNLPSGADFDTTTGSFSWTPDSSQSGEHMVEFEVMDTNENTDSEIITIIVNDVLQTYNASEYFPLKVGNWWKYIKSTTGDTEKSEVTGRKSINGTNTFIYRFYNGDMEYYTCLSPGLQLFGFNYPSDFEGDIIFNTPLMLWPDGAEIGNQHRDETDTSIEYNNIMLDVHIESTSSIIDMEDVTINNTIFKNCLKASVILTVIVQETNIVTSTRTFWFHKGTGIVKDQQPSVIWTIKRSYIDGIDTRY